jgi:heme O synthase-like polyprenyltransferase
MNMMRSAGSGMLDGDARDYFALLKPRVMSLVVFTALVGLLMAPGQIHPVIGFIAILAIAVGGGASGALNMWYDADIDQMMGRTAKRPIPAGGVRRDALAFGLFLSVFSVAVLGPDRQLACRPDCWPSRFSSTPSSTRCGSSARRRKTSSSVARPAPSRRSSAGPA